jgi:hypothetical protein
MKATYNKKPTVQLQPPREMTRNSPDLPTSWEAKAIVRKRAQKAGCSAEHANATMARSLRKITRFFNPHISVQSEERNFFLFGIIPSKLIILIEV